MRQGVKEPNMQKPDERQAVPRLRRREFFKVGATSFMGFHLLPMLSPLSAFAEKKVLRQPAGPEAPAIGRYGAWNDN